LTGLSDLSGLSVLSGIPLDAVVEFWELFPANQVKNFLFPSLFENFENFVAI
jgi:hypothetical protein